MKIELTETEILHIMDALDARIEDLGNTVTFGDDPMIQDQIGEMRDLATDLFEAISRQDDGWDSAPTELEGFTFTVRGEELVKPWKVNHDRHIAETQMFNAGVDAREKTKATSRAARRRQSMSARMMAGTITSMIEGDE
jgi:hypothetical protein